VADALSQKYEDEGSLFSLSFIVPDWLQVVHQEWIQDPTSWLATAEQDPRVNEFAGRLINPSTVLSAEPVNVYAIIIVLCIS
jgi:hypothetical protein